NLLGRNLLFMRNDVASAVGSLTSAVTLNPHVARYWLDLATAHEISGEREQQRTALEAAVAAEPTTPGVAWDAGNFYLIRGDIEKALPQLRVVMERDPSRVGLALDRGWRASGDVDRMLAEALPRQAGIHLAFLDLLAEKQQTAACQKVWARIRELKQPLPTHKVALYIQYLIREREAGLAWMVWRDLLALNGHVESALAMDNLVVNGGFEDRVLNGGFDWTYRLSPAVKLTIDTNQAHSGVRSLLLEFGGDPIADAGIFQYVRVEPNTEYEFSVYTRSQDIISARGPSLILQDAYEEIAYFETSDVLGSSVWNQQRGTFRTGGTSHLLILRIVRSPSASRIRGRLWIDDVSLSRQ
ncbi:MAG: carbohydrate binding domain-containing protein, partial [Acidobacteria bacterium]|nr:carbohydrate binding domain-containing protein [Acidobacteriota bacterium]